MTGKSMDNFVTKDPVSNIPRMFVLPDPPKCDKKDRNICNRDKRRFNLICDAYIAMILLFGALLLGAYVIVDGDRTRCGLRKQPVMFMITVFNGSSLLENHSLNKNSSRNSSYLLLANVSRISVAVDDNGIDYLHLYLFIALLILFAFLIVSLPVVIHLLSHVEEEQKKCPKTSDNGPLKPLTEGGVVTQLVNMHSEANRPVFVTVLFKDGPTDIQ